MKFRFKPRFGLQFLLAIAVAVSLGICMISMFSKKGVSPSLEPNAYRLVPFARWHGQYYGGTDTLTDSLYLLEIGSPHQYIVRLHYYDWEMKETISTELNPGVGECILRFMPKNPGFFAHDLRSQQNQCYLQVKGLSTYRDSYDVSQRKISEDPLFAIMLFDRQRGSGGFHEDTFRYLSEEKIKSSCDAKQIGCIWVTLEPVGASRVR